MEYCAAVKRQWQATARDRVNVSDTAQEETGKPQLRGGVGLTDVRRERGGLSCKGPGPKTPASGRESKGSGTDVAWGGVSYARTHTRMHIHVLRCTLTKRAHFPIS